MDGRDAAREVLGLVRRGLDPAQGAVDDAWMLNVRIGVMQGVEQELATEECGENLGWRVFVPDYVVCEN